MPPFSKSVPNPLAVLAQPLKQKQENKIKNSLFIFDPFYDNSYNLLNNKTKTLKGQLAQ